MSAYSFGQTHQGEQRVRQYVKGEATSFSSGFYSVESSVGEAREPDKTTQEFEAAPCPIAEQQPFSAPQMEWDAIQ